MKTLALCLLLTACNAIQTPDVVSSRGVQSYLHGLDAGLTKAAADAMEDDLYTRLKPYDLGAPLALREASVDWVADYYGCGYLPDGGEIFCAGTEQDFDIKVVVQDCVWQTAYRYELLHLTLLEDTGDADATHSSPAWQAVYGSTQTCEVTP